MMTLQQDRMLNNNRVEHGEKVNLPTDLGDKVKQNSEKRFMNQIKRRGQINKQTNKCFLSN